MKEKVIFIAGVYGVGKSTLCSELSRLTGVPAYSAGDLISAQNREVYGSNKLVKDKDANQRTLIAEIKRILSEEGPFFLAGHFCIFGKENCVEILPEAELMAMDITRIILLEASFDRIIENLSLRDGKSYDKKDIIALQTAELSQAIRLSQAMNAPLLRHLMKFDGNDANKIMYELGDDFR